MFSRRKLLGYHRPKLGALSYCLPLLVALAAAINGLAPVRFSESAAATTGQVATAQVSTATPDVNDGAVDAIARVGTKVYLGGDFTNATSRGSSTPLTRNSILAFDANNGILDPLFLPILDGPVNQIEAGPDNSLYLAGSFKTVNGQKMRVARIDATTGAVMTGWNPPALSAATTSLAFVGGTLYVSGIFVQTAGLLAGGLVALNPLAGTVQPWFAVSVAGQHGTGPAVGGTGPKRIDVTPDGRNMVVIGNFTSATDSGGALARDQVMLLAIEPGISATIRRDWSTLAFSAQCFNIRFASTVRDVRFSPDGTFFVVASSGGEGTNIDGTRGTCDTAVRFETLGTGTNVRPTWSSYTGRDSLWSVDISTGAVYVGGHQRWMNNELGRDNAGAGAVPRPGIAALDPATGVPLSWNPGRNPRGVGAFAVLATEDGLYVGSDTEWIGNFQTRRPRVAFFPLTGGVTVPPGATGALPGTAYLAGFSASPGAPATLAARSLSATDPLGPTVQVDTATLDWNAVRGMFAVDNTVFYGLSDGSFHRRSFDGRVFGPDQIIDPYNDAFWSDKSTGKPAQTYRGLVPGYYAQLASVTSAFYAHGRLYYTLSGRSTMFFRNFNVESGIISGTEQVVADGLDWSGVSGAFATSNELYFANAADGALRKYPWTGSQATGSPVVVDTSASWAGRSLFLRTGLLSPGKRTTPVEFRAENSATASGVTSTRVTIPSTVRAGDGLVLFSSINVNSTSVGPPGWQLVASRTQSNAITTKVYSRVATAADSGAAITVTFPAAGKVTATVVAYSGTDPSGPIAAQASALDAATANHSTPAVVIPAEAVGGRALSYWVDKSSAPATSWTVPAGTLRRAAQYGANSGALSSQLAETTTVLAAGTAPARTASVNVTGDKGLSWTLLLRPATTN